MRKSRPLPLVSILSCLVLTTAGFGCHSARPHAGENGPTSSPTLSASSGIMSEARVDHNDFRAKVERGQEVGVHLDVGRGYESQ
jgi:hypothetical protein